MNVIPITPLMMLTTIIHCRSKPARVSTNSTSNDKLTVSPSESVTAITTSYLPVGKPVVSTVTEYGVVLILYVWPEKLI